MEKITATVSAIEDITPTVKRFVLNPHQPFDYQPGQWLDLYLTIDGQESIGGYSLTSSPAMPHLELAVKKAQQHPVTKALHETIQPGDSVTICGGQGTCVYHRDMGGAVVLLAGGIGITPLMGILRYMATPAADTPVTLFYSSDAPDEFAFAKEIQALTAQYPHIQAHFTLTQPHAEWSGSTSRIGRAHLQTTDPAGSTLYYLCGPKAMLNDLEQPLLELGATPDRIRYERW